MITNQKYMWAALGFLAVVVVCGFGLLLGILSRRGTFSPSQPAVPNTPPASPVIIFVPEPSATPTTVIVATATPLPTDAPTTVPTLPPATPDPAAQAATDFEDMVQYAEAIKPILEEGLAAAERDNDVLKGVRQDPEAMCGAELAPHPTLAADAVLMEGLVNRLNGLTPPKEAADSVHKPLVESMRLWRDALKNINLSCQTDEPTGQNLLRVGAMLQLGGALVNFQTASTNFWRLVITKGLEEIVGPLPLGTPISPP